MVKVVGLMQISRQTDLKYIIYEVWRGVYVCTVQIIFSINISQEYIWGRILIKHILNRLLISCSLRMVSSFLNALKSCLPQHEKSEISKEIRMCASVEEVYENEAKAEWKESYTSVSVDSAPLPNNTNTAVPWRIFIFVIQFSVNRTHYNNNKKLTAVLLCVCNDWRGNNTYRRMQSNLFAYFALFYLEVSVCLCD